MNTWWDAWTVLILFGSGWFTGRAWLRHKMREHDWSKPIRVFDRKACERCGELIDGDFERQVHALRHSLGFGDSHA